MDRYPDEAVNYEIFQPRREKSCLLDFRPGETHSNHTEKSRKLARGLKFLI